MDAFFACDRFTFPNIFVLLHLALTMPIMSCESERSFSQAAQAVEDPHRSTTSASRLGSLALMEINREECNRIQETVRKRETSPIFISNAANEGLRSCHAFCAIINKFVLALNYGNRIGLMTPSGCGLEKIFER